LVQSAVSYALNKTVIMMKQSACGCVTSVCHEQQHCYVTLMWISW